MVLSTDQIREMLVRRIDHQIGIVVGASNLIARVVAYGALASGDPHAR
jgi:hypothetical protein